VLLLKRNFIFVGLVLLFLVWIVAMGAVDSATGRGAILFLLGVSSVVLGFQWWFIYYLSPAMGNAVERTAHHFIIGFCLAFLIWLFLPLKFPGQPQIVLPAGLLVGAVYFAYQAYVQVWGLYLFAFRRYHAGLAHMNQVINRLGILATAQEYSLRGAFYQALHQYEAARDNFTFAMNHIKHRAGKKKLQGNQRSEFINCLMWRGINSIGLKQVDQALSDADTIIQMEPKSAWSYVIRASFLIDAEQYPAARAAVKYAFTLNPPPYVASILYRSRGLLAFIMQDAAAAMADYAQALTFPLHPYQQKQLHPVIYSNQGNVYFEQAEYSRALECYQQALRLDPHFAFARAGAAATYFALEQPAQARHIWQQLIAEDPYFANAEWVLEAYFTWDETLAKTVTQLIAEIVA
jgi:tetratricopeptide (TPR) repeat protein